MSVTLARLIYCNSANPSMILGDVMFSGVEGLSLGRWEGGAPVPDIALTLGSVSRGWHARIIGLPDSSWALQHLGGKLGTRMYERVLQKDDQAQLEAIDYFSLPGETDSVDGERIICLFVQLSSSATMLGRPLTLFPESRKARLYTRTEKLLPTEYRLLDFLYKNRERLCSTREIIAQVWGTRSGRIGDPEEAYRRQIDSLRHKLRGGKAGDAGERHCFVFKNESQARLHLEDVDNGQALMQHLKADPQAKQATRLPAACS